MIFEVDEWTDGETDYYEETRECSECDGSGYDYCIPHNPCPCCGGRGMRSELYWKRKNERWEDQYDF